MNDHLDNSPVCLISLLSQAFIQACQPFGVRRGQFSVEHPMLPIFPFQNLSWTLATQAA
jgi:hypothetical protein